MCHDELVSAAGDYSYTQQKKQGLGRQLLSLYPWRIEMAGDGAMQLDSGKVIKRLKYKTNRRAHRQRRALPFE